MDDQLLIRFQNWFASQCDEDWEHCWGIKIGTLDNPGWDVKIDLENTELDGKPFQRIEFGVGSGSDHTTDWYAIWVDKNVFNGVGDPSKLEFILRTFLDWADKYPIPADATEAHGWSCPPLRNI